ncbi:MAG: ribbon-helix-helix protein, CopG family [Dehalococcoidia bacterium]
MELRLTETQRHAGGRPATGRWPMVGVKVSPETYAKLQARAEKTGETPSEFLRRIIEHEVVRERPGPTARRRIREQANGKAA